MTTSEFLAAGAGSRFGARVDELRRDEFRIASRAVREGLYLYTLTGDVERDAENRPRDGNRRYDGPLGVSPDVALCAPERASAGKRVKRPTEPEVQDESGSALPDAASPAPALFDPPAPAEDLYRDYDPENEAA